MSSCSLRKPINTMRRNSRLFLAIIVTVTLMAAVIGTAFYMLDYSLGYAKEDRRTAEYWKKRMKRECPWTARWQDSIYRHACIRDTFVTMPSQYKAHALYLFAPKPTAKTAVIVHGYKVRAEGMLHIAYLYNHELGYNVLLPDLYAHGESHGDHIQMGWNDRWDVMRWAEVADEIFADSLPTQQVLHGISMGAATIMALSGEMTPAYILGFVEDCGFSSVWEEFSGQLKDQFGLPSFPLMNVTSLLCNLRYGWSFSEANQKEQVRQSTKPMLFIHGDKDTFVPYHMLAPLYQAKMMGFKDIYVAEGSEHANAYADHRQEYSRRVKEFVNDIIDQ